MLKTTNLPSLSKSIIFDKRNSRLIVNNYAPNTKPSSFGRHLIDLAAKKNLEKIWLWASPRDVSEFLRGGFRLEGSLLGEEKKFSISLAYYVNNVRGHSTNSHLENEILNTIRLKPISKLPQTPSEVELKLLDESFAEEISELLTRVFTTYPSPVDNPQYIRSLIQKGNIFAGAISRNCLVAVAATYPDHVLNRCEMTDCATLKEYRGRSLSESCLGLLEQELKAYSNLTLYTLARAQSYGMNRVFHKLGYKFQGRLINNCHIAGSFEDMNLWVR
ncbi:putative beta-lysine N-acetyltransferase [Desulfosporosinus sp. FKB]|uniref:putative beta-lysine N-acetyltransferase n=1 Tax=Desulfosporosinus sp. FKB TaxID=1969835 RepID=UPI000B49CE38|nr:putative beta-lysine N-acetyltransferase [Desulfosporosinus sp. FKB]